MSDLQEIARTVATMATAGMKPQDLVAAVRSHHPDASKKQVSRAAFLAMIVAAESDPAHARRVQELALAARVEPEDDQPDAVPVPGTATSRKKRKGRRKAA